MAAMPFSTQAHTSHGLSAEHRRRGQRWFHVTTALVAILGAGYTQSSWAATNYAAGKPVTVSSIYQTYYGSNAVDSVVSDESRWLGVATNTGNWLVVDLGSPVTLVQAHVYSGYQSQAGSAIQNIQLQAWSGSVWTNIPGASVTNNTSFALALDFTSPVTASRVRFFTADTVIARLREITLWDEPVPLYSGVTGSYVPTPIDVGPPIRVNQIGYQFGAPKRFTAPTSADGTAYTITTTNNANALFSGIITGGCGDFSMFEPTHPGPYVIRVTIPNETPGVSDPFLVESNLISDQMIPPAIEFMVDARSGVGTHPSAYGGCAWRDGTYYSFEIPSLIYLVLNDPKTIRSLPQDIDYGTDKARVLDPSFDSIYLPLAESSGFLDALRRYYTNEPPLLKTNSPDAVQCIHYGLGVTLERPATKDPSGDARPEQIHAQTVEWSAYFLYAWPELREWIPDSFYRRVRDFAFAQWGVSAPNDPSSLEVDPLWSPSTYGTNNAPYKGRHCPGHSILPNLLMWQVALRESRSDATNYLNAAQRQTQWIIDNLDWNDPRTTKGQRMSEHKMMPGLAYFQTHFPSQAPPGLEAKIESWVDTMIASSDNMWDFRRYELSDFDGDGFIDWSIPAGTANWNEPGNLAGFPACALSAASAIHDAAKKQRLREMAWAALDCLFGRNPIRAASPARPEMGFPDVERGWPKVYSGPAAFLETARGTLNSSPGTELFPFNPNGALRYHEGWVNFNAAWNVGLAFLLADLKETDPLAVHLPVVISEILPAPTADPLAEYIELYNPTPYPARLSGLILSGGVTFAFPTNTLMELAAGARCLLVRNRPAFEKVFGTNLPVVGTFAGDLDDSGESISLGDVNGNTFASVNYGGPNPHPGYSVVFTGKETTFPLGPWRTSAYPGGSPGGTDSVFLTADPYAMNANGVPNLLQHAVTGLDHAYVPPSIALSGRDAVVTASRNLRADDTTLTLEWSTNLTSWQPADFDPASEVPNGDGTVTRTWRFRPSPDFLFVRLQAVLVKAP